MTSSHTSLWLYVFMHHWSCYNGHCPALKDLIACNMVGLWWRHGKIQHFKLQVRKINEDTVVLYPLHLWLQSSSQHTLISHQYHVAFAKYRKTSHWARTTCKYSCLLLSYRGSLSTRFSWAPQPESQYDSPICGVTDHGQARLSLNTNIKRITMTSAYCRQRWSTIKVILNWVLLQDITNSNCFCHSSFQNIFSI